MRYVFWMTLPFQSFVHKVCWIRMSHSDPASVPTAGAAKLNYKMSTCGKSCASLFFSSWGKGKCLVWKCFSNFKSATSHKRQVATRATEEILVQNAVAAPNAAKLNFFHSLSCCATCFFFRKDMQTYNSWLKWDFGIQSFLEIGQNNNPNTIHR